MEMNDGVSKKRFLAAFLVLCIAIAVAPFGSSAGAQETTGPNIEFLNPSNFSEVPPPTSPDPQVPQQPGTIIVSDRPTQNPDAGAETYRLSAWVSGIPQNPAVEFELLTRAGVSLQIIDDVIRVGADTFEADWDIPDTLPDGPYTIRATLAEGIVGVDNVDQDIVIQRFAERAEITYPDTRSGSGQYGMFVPLATSVSSGTDAVASPNPVGNIENRTTTDAPGSGPGRVRAFYTISEPGTRPEWKRCGTETGPGSYPFVSSSNGVRCTLEAVEHLHLVRAVALVANNTKIGQPYDPSANQAGDATRTVEPYAQVPTTIELVEGQSGQAESGGCYLVTVGLTDQFSREVLGANMDVQAWGPNDRLKFGAGFIGEWEAEPPDRGGHANEAGMDCWTEEEDNPDVGDQGEHQVIGGPDVKHVEVDEDGTDDNGEWGFEVFVPAGSVTAERRTTYWEIWLDEANDGSGANNDVYDSLELCRSGLISWDGPASSAPMTGTTPSCPTAPPSPCENDAASTQTETCPTPTDSPSPSPSASETEEPPTEEDAISITSNRHRVRKGRRVRFSGTVDGAPDCVAGRRVILQSPRKGTGFRKRAATVTDAEGGWSVTRRLWKTKQWRAVARSSDGCERVVSGSITVKVRRR